MFISKRCRIYICIHFLDSITDIITEYLTLESFVLRFCVNI